MINPIKPIGPITGDRSHPSHLSYRSQKQKLGTRHCMMSALIFLLGPMVPIGRMGPIRFVSRIDRRDGIDHDGSYRHGIGLIPLIKSPGLDRDRSLITHRGRVLRTRRRAQHLPASCWGGRDQQELAPVRRLRIFLLPCVVSIWYNRSDFAGACSLPLWSVGEF